MNPLRFRNIPSSSFLYVNVIYHLKLGPWKSLVAHTRRILHPLGTSPGFVFSSGLELFSENTQAFSTMQKLGTGVKKGLRLVLGNYVVLVVLLVSLELIGQLAFKLYAGKFIIELFTPEKDWIFESHPYLGISLKRGAFLKGEELTFRIDSLGFRATTPLEYQENEASYNIVCVGGSTTFGVNVSDYQTWPFLLQDTLGKEFRVYNLGVPGYSTLEAMLQLTTIVPELDPDLIIFFQGWNDLHYYHVRPKTSMYHWHVNMVREGVLVQSTPITRWYEALFLFRLSRRIGRYLSQTTPLFPRKTVQTYRVPDPYIDSLYTRNLQTLNTLAKHLEAQPLFIPQVINKTYLLNTQIESDRWTPTIHNHAFPDLMDHINGIMIQTFQDTPNLVLKNNGMNPYRWEESDFTDHGHFSYQGNKKFADMIYQWIDNNLPEMQPN
ncbi:MAG: SGNH/GDSL hydrolase family protein [Bacteroidota bacterium]